ncbi:MAG: glycosyltransferase family 2 protein [Spirochaetota bacterium]
MKNTFVSVIVPCYNERGNILPLISAIHHELSFCRHEIIVVDDNSPDGTYALVTSKRLPYVKAICRPRDPSLARSIRTGLEAARGNIFIAMDSDFNHDPGYIPHMVMNLEHYDCVSASRFVYGGKMESRFRHVASWFFNIFVRLVTRKFVTDSLYGYWAIKKKVIERIPYGRVFWGYGDYCIRLMYYLQEEGASILQFPAVNGRRKSGTGNSRFLKTLIQYTAETLKLAFGIFPREQ